MDTNTLMKIYYAFMHSIISYGIIAWGGAYKNTVNILQNIQTKILKIINKNRFETNNPLNIKQTFVLESLVYHYDKLKNTYLTRESKTRNKNIILPRMNKTISDKNSYIMAIKTYNSLPTELKSLNNKSITKRKIKKWIQNNNGC